MNHSFEIIAHHGQLMATENSSAFITVWKTTEPNQTIGYQGPIGASGFSGTISVYNDITGELISEDVYTGPKDSALWPTMANAGTYRIEILGGFPFIDTENTEGYNRYLLIKVISLGETNLDPLGLKHAFFGCENLILCELGSADFSHITSLAGTWYYCTRLVDFPNVSGFTAVTTLEQTWMFCESMVDAPAVFTLIDVENLRYTWADCTSLLVAPEVSALIKVTGLVGAWSGCSGIVSAPDVSSLVNVKSIAYAWRGCSFETAPDISNLVNVASMKEAFYRNDNLITVNIPTSVNYLTVAGGYEMLHYCDNVSTTSIDGILNRAYASVVANGGKPTGVYLHLGTNKYTAAGQDAYNYLSRTAGWRITSGGLL